MNNKSRTLLHIDGDAFFVGVEVAKNPKLRGLPVVTGAEKGIVTALSYEAKALGIVRGMPTYRVKRDYSKVIILSENHKSYSRYSAMMFDIVRRYADLVEEYSIDECFADLTGLNRPLKMSYRQIAERIKKEINDELKLSVSIGIASSKVLAKLASKWVKPNGLTIIDIDNDREFYNNIIMKTPIEKVWGIGPRTSSFLKNKGIHNVKDFINKDIEWIRDNLSSPYEIMHMELKGESKMRIDPVMKTAYSSIQKTRSFHPFTNEIIFLLSEISKHIEDACTKARYYRLVAKKFSILLKTKDFQYSTITIPLSRPTNTPEPLMKLAKERIEEIYKGNILYRTTGIVLYNLTPENIPQENLFGDTIMTDKLELVHKQIDQIENKYKKRIVYLASTHKALKRKGD